MDRIRATTDELARGSSVPGSGLRQATPGRRGAGFPGPPATSSGRSVVTLEEVTKRYRGGGGIEEVSLEVLPGEVFAFLGPNGAGKTTTIRLVLDLIRPDRGRIAVFGLDPRRYGVAVRRRLGYLPGDLALYDRLTARELLTHFAHLRGGPPWTSVAELTERFELDVDQTVREMSKGNRQKVGLVQALMGNPELLILDEPTSGLDPLVQQQVHEVMRSAAAAGRSVFLSSHVLSEVAHVADRVAMIRAGAIVAVERMSDLQSRAVHVVEARFGAPVGDGVLEAVDGVQVVRAGARSVRLEVAGDLNPLVRELARHRLTDLTVREPDLEELFLAYYRGDAAPHAPMRTEPGPERGTNG